MRVSLKLMLMSVAFLAVLAAWIRVRRDYAITETKLRRNAHRGITTVDVPEVSAPPSRLTVDATGAVTHARLYGPAGYAAIKERPVSKRQISSIWFNSMNAVRLFDPGEFPDLSWLAIDDSFDIDFANFSLQWLEPIPKLEGLNVFAHASDPQSALATLPQMQPLMLVLSTDQIDSFKEFPRVASVTSLSVHVPNDRNIDSILQTLESQSSDCQIEVRDDYNP